MLQNNDPVFLQGDEAYPGVAEDPTDVLGYGVSRSAELSMIAREGDMSETFVKAVLDAGGFCITDVGSTTTKAILFRRDPNWRYFYEEVPTTVEQPHEDVMVGVTAA